MTSPDRAEGALSPKRRIKVRHIGLTELWGRRPRSGEFVRIDDTSHTEMQQREFARIYAEVGWTDLTIYRICNCAKRRRALSGDPR
jgi:hypothetical protein